MEILAQNLTAAQETLERVLRGMPVVANDSWGRLCVLIRDLPDGLERFVLYGIADSKQFHVLTKDQERELAVLCEREALTITYQNHGMEYMGKAATIIYPQISGPSCSAAVALIPWFMRIGSPYPIFANMYGCWHYLESGRKSMQESAEAVAKVFGIASFNKSTISRNLRHMDRILVESRISGPLSAEEQEMPPFASLALLVPKLLKPSQATAGVDGMRGGAPSPMPIGGSGPVRGGADPRACGGDGSADPRARVGDGSADPRACGGDGSADPRACGGDGSADPRARVGDGSADPRACGGDGSADPRACAAADRGGAAHAAMGSIPRALSEVIERKNAAPQSSREARKRPARRRGAARKRARPSLAFAKPLAIAQARMGFIAACRGIVMDAAARYHSAML